METPILEPEAPPAATAPKKTFWKKVTGRRFLFFSILAHVVFALIATLFVVQSITAKRKLTFTSAPPSPNPSQRALEHQVQMVKKQKTMSAPVQARRITSTGLAKITLPDMPEMPKGDDFTPTKMAGLGGMTMGLGVGSGSTGNGSGLGGGGVPFFGLRDTGTGSLEGTFYDFKRDPTGKADKFSPNDFASLLKAYSKSGNIPGGSKYFKSKTKLYSKFFLFPAITDTQAGGAFQSPESGPGSWLAIYRGNFSVPESGNYRFVGFGDNVMFVRTTGRLLLDASDHGYSGDRRTAGGNISFPNKAQTPIFFGGWFDGRKGESRPIEIAVGDEGGIFCAGLFIQKQGTDYAQGDRGVPKLPLFIVGPLTPGDKQGLVKYVLPECVEGQIFPAGANVAKSIFDKPAPSFP